MSIMHLASLSAVRRCRCHSRHTRRHHTSAHRAHQLTGPYHWHVSYLSARALHSGQACRLGWFSLTVTLSPGAFGFMPSQVAHIAMVLSVEWWLVPLFLFSIQLIGGWRPTNRSAHTSRMLHGYEDPDTRILADLQALVIGLLARIRKEPLSPER